MLVGLTTDLLFTTLRVVVLDTRLLPVVVVFVETGLPPAVDFVVVTLLALVVVVTLLAPVLAVGLFAPVLAVVLLAPVLVVALFAPVLAVVLLAPVLALVLLEAALAVVLLAPFADALLASALFFDAAGLGSAA